jgi:hypothetical protein
LSTGGGDVLAFGVSGLSGATSYYLQDGLGSTAQLADTTGAVTDSYTYDAFGALRTTTGATANDFRFTGQQNDAGAARGL